MPSIDRIVGIGSIAGGIVLAVFSWQLDLGTWKIPGPGAWPFLLAITLSLIGGWLVFRPQPQTQGISASIPRWGKWAMALGTLFGYVFILEPLGYIVATLLLLLVQIRWVEDRPWTTSLLTAALAAVISFLIFGLWLKVLLPSGIIPIRAGS